MNSTIARVRMSEVLKVDSINSSEGDFLATHVPFKKLSFNQMYGGKENHTSASEDEIFNKIFQCDNFDEKHQFVIVEGSSGAGKSHFIRWLNAKLKSSEENNDLVLLIRRSDNTLKGTIKQLLLKDEIKNIENREIIERLTKANNTIASEAFKMDIFYKFLAKIAYDIKENVNEMLNNPTKQKLLELLKDSMMEAKILESGGPIERIYLKVSSDSSDVNHDVVALFDKSDFILDIDFVENMKENGATRKAERMADKLIVDDDDTLPSEIASYMNSFVDDVIHECAGIEPGDFQQIFKDIRHELKRKGKGLILLIEDITAFTGINQELLNALVTSHTGLNEEEEICRLTSIVGTTSEYYRQFRDNYRDRVTSEIKINDGAIGDDKHDLVEFVARYLNVMSLEKDEINDWYKNGSNQDEYPIHDVTDGIGWDTFTLPNKKELNLYPFTTGAIINLYNGMNKVKTPRYILRFIVEKAVYDALENKLLFPSFCSGYSLSRLNTSDESQIYNYANKVYTNKDENAKQLSRIKYLITYWGSASLVSETNSYAGLSLSIYEELGLKSFINVAYSPASKGTSGQTATYKTTVNEPAVANTALSEEKDLKKASDSLSSINTENIIKVKTNVSDDQKFFSGNKLDSMDEISVPVADNKPVLSTSEMKRREKYEIHLEKIRKWLEDETSVLTIEQKIRDVVCKFVLSSINWQDEGVPYLSKALVDESPKKLIGFEGQEKGLDNSIFVLERNRESYQLLVAFGKYYYLGNESWDFDGSSSAVYIVTSWLTNNKNKFIEFVKGETDENNIPAYIRNAMILEIYRQYLNKNYTSKLVDFSADKLLKKCEPKSHIMNLGHNDKWKDILSYLYDNKIEDNHSMVINYFKTIQGSQINSNRVIVRYTDLEFALDVVKKSKLKPEFNKPDAVSAKNKPTEMLKKLTERISVVATEEKNKALELYKRLLNHLGLDDDDEIEEDDIKELLNDISDFYNDAIAYGCNIENMKEKIAEFKRKMEYIVKSCSIVNKSLDIDDALKLIIMYSKDPIRYLEQLDRFLTKVNRDIITVENHVNNDKSHLRSDGVWIDGKDPRFAEKKSGFNELYSSAMK